MELRMYLYARRERCSCIEGNPLGYPPELGAFKELPYEGQGLTEDFWVGYWEKANAINRWIKEKADQETIGEYTLSEKLIKELRNLCMDVMVNPGEAAKLLPTEAGLFFGDAENADEYFRNIRYTIDLMNAALKMIERMDEKERDNWSFIYKSNYEK